MEREEEMAFGSAEIGRRSLLARTAVGVLAYLLGGRISAVTGRFFGVMAPGVASAEGMPATPPQAGCPGGACLSVGELDVLGALTGVIIPADSTGPGAREAGVAQRLHTMLGGDPVVRQRYVDGLRGFDDLATSRYGAGFAGLAPTRQTELFAYVETAKQILWSETPPSSFIDRVRKRLANVYYRRVVGVTDPTMALLDQLLRDTPEAFYATKAAWDTLGYSGPPFPFGYAGRQTTCAATTSRT